MVGWHCQLDGHESEQALGVGDGQWSRAGCSPWGRRVGHDWATELNLNLSHTGYKLTWRLAPKSNFSLNWDYHTVTASSVIQTKKAHNSVRADRHQWGRPRRPVRLATLVPEGICAWGNFLMEFKTCNTNSPLFQNRNRSRVVPVFFFKSNAELIDKVTSGYTTEQEWFYFSKKYALLNYWDAPPAQLRVSLTLEYSTVAPI